MIDDAIAELAPLIGVRDACTAVGRPQANHYRRHRQSPTPQRPKRERKPQPRALTSVARAEVRAVLNSPEHVDKAPAAVYHELLDRGVYLASVSTMYRVLREHDEVRERRRQATHPARRECGWGCGSETVSRQPSTSDRSAATVWARFCRSSTRAAWCGNRPLPNSARSASVARTCTSCRSATRISCTPGPSGPNAFSRVAGSERWSSSSTSAVWCHHEDVHMDTSAESTTLPIGLASFAGGFAPVRRLVHRDHENVVSRHEYAVGSHHAAHQVPDVVVAHPRGFCRDLLAGHVDS